MSFCCFMITTSKGFFVEFCGLNLSSSFCRYKSREEFANDARLVFRNCDIFNEDDSEVCFAEIFSDLCLLLSSLY